MWLECCRTERGDNSGVRTFCVEGPAHAEQERGARYCHTCDSARQGGQCAVCSVRRAGGQQQFEETSWVWGCRVGGEEEWGNPMAVSQAASYPHFSKEQRERRVLRQASVGASAEPAHCGSSAAIPAASRPLPCCSQRSWYPVAIATRWLPVLVGEAGWVDWPPIGGVESSSVGGQDGGLPPPCCRAQGTISGSVLDLLWHE